MASNPLDGSAPLPAVRFLNAFDARAGSQRIGAMLLIGFRVAGSDARVSLGFGGSGFLSSLPGVKPFFAIDDTRWRRRLYTVWVSWANVTSAVAALRGRVIWVNTVFALPAAFAAIVVRPRTLVVHVHELTMPWLFHWMVGLAARRGATIVTVSRYHAARLEIPSVVLRNAVGATPPDPPSQRSDVIFVGDWRVAKGMDLFIAIARHGLPWRPVAILAGKTDDYPPPLLAAAADAGVTVRFGISDPAEMYGQAALALQLTDSTRWDETFSLTAAEAVWHLVPVAAAGSEAVEEVAGAGLAFSLSERDPLAFAHAVRALAADPLRMARLIAGCEAQRPALDAARFQAEALALLRSVGTRAAR